jgi:hypothetical protein
MGDVVREAAFTSRVEGLGHSAALSPS